MLYTYRYTYKTELIIYCTIVRIYIIHLLKICTLKIIDIFNAKFIVNHAMKIEFLMSHNLIQDLDPIF